MYTKKDMAKMKKMDADKRKHHKALAKISLDAAKHHEKMADSYKADKKKVTKTPIKLIIKIGAPGKTPLKFKKGALHRQLGVAEGKKIPTSKKEAALSGKLGPLAKKRADFAYKGALKAGRKTVAKNAAKKK